MRLKLLKRDKEGQDTGQGKVSRPDSPNQAGRSTHVQRGQQGQQSFCGLAPANDKRGARKGARCGRERGQCKDHSCTGCKTSSVDVDLIGEWDGEDPHKHKNTVHSQKGESDRQNDKGCGRAPGNALLYCAADAERDAKRARRASVGEVQMCVCVCVCVCRMSQTFISDLEMGWKQVKLFWRSNSRL